MQWQDYLQLNLDSLQQSGNTWAKFITTQYQKFQNLETGDRQQDNSDIFIPLALIILQFRISIIHGSASRDNLWLLPGTMVLKSPTGREMGKSTASKICVIKIHHTGIQSAKLKAPPAYIHLLAPTFKRGEMGGGKLTSCNFEAKCNSPVAMEK